MARLGYILLIILLNIFAFSGSANAFVLVIDPGHGGKDTGAHGKTGLEKDINLSVALLVGQCIAKEHPDVKVIYTRKRDVFIGLYERADIANKANANLFISIHTNAMIKNSTFKGAEVYTFGVKNMEENLEVARRENSVILLEDNYKQKYEGFNPKSAESYIMFQYMINLYAEQSIKFASLVQKELVKTAKRVNKGVKQAGYLVLRRSTMPRILIELDYISNSEAEEYLLSAAGQSILARSICNAFTEYKKEFDQVEKKKGSTSENVSLSKSVLPDTKQSSGQKSSSSDPPKNTETAKKTEPPKKSDPPPKSELEKKSDPLPKSAPPKKSDPPQKSDIVKQSTSPATPGRIYKVQILALSQKLSDKAPEFKGYNVKFYLEGRFYKYTYGESPDWVEINNLRKEVAKDFSGAFIIAYENGVKVPVN